MMMIDGKRRGVLIEIHAVSYHSKVTVIIK